jgi:hypothetical protein
MRHVSARQLRSARRSSGGAAAADQVVPLSLHAVGAVPSSATARHEVAVEHETVRLKMPSWF